MTRGGGLSALLVCALWLCFAQHAAARLATENVTLDFNPSFFKGKPLSLMPALYGSARYGEKVTGRLVYSVPGNRQGCVPIKPENDPGWPIGENIILMLDRGDCAFEQKTWHAQRVGALAVILVDNMKESMLPYMSAGGYAEEIIIPSVMIHKQAGDRLKQYLCDCTNIAAPGAAPSKPPIPAPLPVGTKVEVNWESKGTYYPGKIHSLVPMSAIKRGPGGVAYDITYDDGDEENSVPRERIRLIGKGGVRGGQGAQSASTTTPANFYKRRIDASLTWGISKLVGGDKVRATLWTSADDANAVEFKREFAVVAQGLGTNLDLQVNYFLRSGRATGCQPTGRFNCRGQCTNTGRYCAPDPDNDAFYGLDGEDIVRENMRQLCVQNISRAENRLDKWWSYVNKANAMCGNFKILPDAQKCRSVAVVESIMREVGIKPEMVSACVKAAGGTAEDGGVNKILEAQLQAAQDANVFLQPTLLINGRQYRGNFACPNPNSLEHCAVLDALCAGLDAAHKNPLCKPDDRPTYEMRFLASDSKMNWRDAELRCVEIGGHLAHLRDGIDNARATKACKSQRCWIGLNDRATEGTFLWTDGTALGKKEAHWAPGEPNNGGVSKAKDSASNTGEDCVYVHGNKYPTRARRGQWGDHPCGDKMDVLCQVPQVFKFTFFAKPLPWEEAEAACKALGDGAHLADIHSIRQDRNVYAKCVAQRCWIGLGDREMEGDYRWSDGVSVGTSKYFAKVFTNWAPGEPNNGGFAANTPGKDEDCVYMHGSGYNRPGHLADRGKWGDHPCSEPMAYVCQQRDVYTHEARERTAYAPIKGEDVTLKVVSPATLAQRFPDGMQVRPSLFGIPPYGGAVSGTLIYAPPKNRALCAPVNDKKAAAGLGGWPRGNVVILAQRGGCSFTRKARIAQRIGARALIVANNDDSSDGSSQNLPYMQTDQDTSDISIPSVIIHSKDGRLLLQEMCGKGQVVVDEDKCSDRAHSDFTKKRIYVRIGWGMPRRSRTVDWTFWTSADDPFSARIKREFAPVAKALGTHVKLNVQYSITAGADIGCYPLPSSSDKCNTLCTNGGRYCSSDWPIANKYVVEENLRQLCVFQESAPDHAKWWKYINAFSAECKMGGYSMRSLRMDPGECENNVAKIYKVMERVGVDINAVKRCVRKSGGTKGDVKNTLLESQIQAQIDQDAFMKPTISVQGARYRGNLDCANPTKTAQSCGLLGAICSGFAAGSEPEICKAHSRMAKKVSDQIEKANTITTNKPPVDARGVPTRLKWTVGSPVHVQAARHDVVLQIGSPQKLIDHFSKSFIETRPSLFGIPAYGGSIRGILVYGDAGNLDACKPFARSKDWPKGRAVIVMADRGGCEFVEKVRNVQRAGAAAAIIADTEENGLIYPGSAGPTDDIAIPSLAIGSKDAEAFRRYLCSGQFIKPCPSKGVSYTKNSATLNIFWSMPHANDFVDWQIWTTSVGSGSISHNTSIGFERQFAPAALALGAHTRLKVHYSIVPGKRFSCAPHFGTADCSKLCSNGGRYCAPDPDGDKSAGLDGIDVVRENLRQACIFNVTTAKKQQFRWWKYVRIFNEECKNGIGSSWEYRCKNKPAKIKSLLQRAGVDSKDVEKCMLQSGGLTKDAPNKIFDAQLAALVSDGVRDLRLTTVIINGVRYRGGLDCDDPLNPSKCGVLNAICAGFAPSTKPPVCGGGLASYKYRLFGAQSKKSKSISKSKREQPGALGWKEAEATCQTYGGHLAKIRSVGDNDRVFAACESARCWIGLNDRAKEGEFVWADNTPAGAYQLWAKGEPNNGGYGSPGVWVDSPNDEDCVYVHGVNFAGPEKQRRWGDHPCNMKMAFVCEIPVDYIQVTAPKTWIEAEVYCNEIGGNLASVLSYADNSKVLGACSNKQGRCWIGLNDLGIPGEYVWSGRGKGSGTGGKKDGVGTRSLPSSPTPTPIAGGELWDDDYASWQGDEGWMDPKALGKGFTAWAPGEPSGSSTGTDERCAYMHGLRYTPAQRRGRWGDHACSLKMASVCEVRVRYAYRFFEDPKDWTSAEQACVKLGGHLATIDSFGDNKRAWSVCDGWRCWIGLNDRGREGQYVWTDGRKLGRSYDGRSHTTFRNWAPGEPNNGGFARDAAGKDEDCGYIHGSKYHPFEKQQTWGDHPCKEKNPYVCQISTSAASRFHGKAKPASPSSAPAPLPPPRSTRPLQPAPAPAPRQRQPPESQRALPQPAPTPHSVMLTLMVTLAGLDAAEMQSKASKKLFSQSVAQLASFDGVQASHVRVVSAVNTGRGVRVQAAITAKNSDAAQQILNDLNKWAGTSHAKELSSVFSSRMGSGVVPSALLVNVGRIDGSADSASVDRQAHVGGGGVINSAFSFVWRGIKFVGIATLACIALLMTWRMYYQAKRHGVGLSTIISRFVSGGTSLPTNATSATARGGAVQYDPLTTDVGDDFLEGDHGDGHLEMQTSTAYAAQQDLSGT